MYLDSEPWDGGTWLFLDFSVSHRQCKHCTALHCGQRCAVAVPCGVAAEQCTKWQRRRRRRPTCTVVTEDMYRAECFDSLWEGRSGLC